MFRTIRVPRPLETQCEGKSKQAPGSPRMGNRKKVVLIYNEVVVLMDLLVTIIISWGSTVKSFRVNMLDKRVVEDVEGFFVSYETQWDINWILKRWGSA